MQTLNLVKFLIGLNALAYFLVAIYAAVVPAISLQPEGLGFSVGIAALTLVCWIFLSLPSAVFVAIRRKQLKQWLVTLGLSTLLFPIGCWLLQVLLSSIVYAVLS